MKTTAAILEKQNCPLIIEEIEIPKLKRGQVLVKIAYSGICRSQINEIKGLKGKDPFLPHTLGHEGSGVVVDIGEGVSKVKIDQKVIISWLKGTGIDAGGCHYFLNDKKINSGPVSTFLEYAIISENRLYPIFDGISLKEASLLGCAIPTGAGLIFNDMKIQRGNSICIIGLGGIGFSSLLAAKYKEANPIIVVDISDRKIEKAMKMGATHSINIEKDDVIEKLKDITKGKKVDFALEAVGKKEAMELAFSCVNDNTGVCILAGNLPSGEKISIDPFDLIKGKKIFGSWGGGTQFERDITSYVDLIKKERTHVCELITHEDKLCNINNVIEHMESGNNLCRAIVAM